MTLFTSVLLTLTLVATAQGAVEEPASYSKRRDDAKKALDQGNAAEAERLFEANVAEAEQLGPDELLLADSLERLAAFHGDNARKQYGKAELLLRRALIIREKTQGCEDADVGETLLGLGMFLTLKEKSHTLAMPLLQRALTIFEYAKGQDDPEVARALHALALHQMIYNQPSDAESNLHRALAIREKVFGPQSAKVAAILDDLGDLHFMQTPLLDSMPNLEALDGSSRPSKSRRPHGKLAEEFYTRALTIREKVLKPGDPLIAESLYNLGQLGLMRFQPRQVESNLTKWLALMDAAKAPMGETHAKVYTMLGGFAEVRHDHSKADGYYAKLQSITARLNGTRSKEFAGCLSARAPIALAEGRFDDAERLLKEAFAIESLFFCHDDPDVTRLRALMSRSYREQLNDPRGPTHWGGLTQAADALSRQHHDLESIYKTYIDLLRRTNRSTPGPTQGDLDYLTRTERVITATNLQDLGKVKMLFGSEMEDEELSHVSRLYALNHLYVSKAVTDAGLSHLRKLVNLKSLSLFSTQITDGGLPYLTGLENLEVLNLAYTRVGDAGLASLANLHHLRELHLDCTNVTDAGLEHLKGLTSLRVLNLQGTKVSAAGVQKLRRDLPELAEVEQFAGEGFRQIKEPPPLIDIGILRTVFWIPIKAGPPNRDPSQPRVLPDSLFVREGAPQAD